MLLLPYKCVGSGGVSDWQDAFAGYLTAITTEEKAELVVASSELSLFKGRKKSLGPSRKFGHSLYFTLKGRFTLLREESFDTASKEANLRILIVTMCLFLFHVCLITSTLNLWRVFNWCLVLLFWLRKDDGFKIWLKVTLIDLRSFPVAHGSTCTRLLM